MMMMMMTITPFSILLHFDFDSRILLFSQTNTSTIRPSTALFLNTAKHAVAVENANTIYNTNYLQRLLNPVDGQQIHKHKYTTNHSRAAQIHNRWLPQLGIFVLQIYKYESLSDVGEIWVWFASKILTPRRMHWNAFLVAQIIAKCHSFLNMYGML